MRFLNRVEINLRVLIRCVIYLEKEIYIAERESVGYCYMLLSAWGDPSAGGPLQRSPTQQMHM